MESESRQRFKGRLLLAVGIVAAAVVALGLHVAADPVIQEWVGRQMKGAKLHRTGPLIGALAFVTAMVDIGAISLVQILMYPRLPGKGPVVKGLAFGVLLLAIRSRFPRMFIMNLAIGNPLVVVLV